MKIPLLALNECKSCKKLTIIGQNHTRDFQKKKRGDQAKKDDFKSWQVGVLLISLIFPWVPAILHFLYARHSKFLCQSHLKDAENVHPSMFSMDAGWTTIIYWCSLASQLSHHQSLLSSRTFDEPNKRMKEKKNPAASSCVASWNICFED